MFKHSFFKCLLLCFVFTNISSAQDSIKTDTLKLEPILTDSVQVIFKAIPYNKTEIKNKSLPTLLLDNSLYSYDSTIQLSDQEKNNLLIGFEQDLITSISDINLNFKKKKKNISSNAYYNSQLVKQLIDKYSFIAIDKNKTAVIDVKKLQFKHESRIKNTQVVWGIKPEKLFVKLSLGRYSGKTLYDIYQLTEEENMKEEITTFLEQL